MELEYEDFEKILDAAGILPNHWCSKPYFLAAKYKIRELYGCVFVVDENDRLAFPPIHPEKGYHYLFSDCWADFEGFDSFFHSPKFLDLEYIYHPEDFDCMEGKRWATYRKNVKKFPKRHENPTYYDSNETVHKSVYELLGVWLESRDLKEEDWNRKVVMHYLFDDFPGIEWKVLYDAEAIFGINVWDENSKYINFRYCFYDTTKGFLCEYLKYLFYTDRQIREKEKPVNDGGIMGNENLRFFKEKMNPRKQRSVKSWQRRMRKK